MHIYIYIYIYIYNGLHDSIRNVKEITKIPKEMKTCPVLIS